MAVNLTIHVKREIFLPRNNICHVAYFMYASIHVKTRSGIIMKKMKGLTLKVNRLTFKCCNFNIQYMTVTTEKKGCMVFPEI